MEIEIKKAINTGFQETHSLIFTCANGKKIKVDLFADEFKELEEQIKQYFGVW
jgi:hypothetical protein